ncbi:hypothetical protein H5410_021885 [Solanum commersonii]|uniref:Uncharacterized protein n=1 Tax=Solanum commersonii TaxID=4109 RepID=A0A9J5ZGJ6_SOLCO|nr:hypothetical protein H5410_021885 [Solanum commersonii]
MISSRVDQYDINMPARAQIDLELTEMRSMTPQKAAIAIAEAEIATAEAAQTFAEVSIKKEFLEVLNDVDALVPKSSYTDEDCINSTSLRHKIGNVISMGEDSAKGEIPINPTDNTINNVNGDKDIGVASRIPKPNAMGDFCIGKLRQGTRSVIPPKRLVDYLWEG